MPRCLPAVCVLALVLTGIAGQAHTPGQTASTPATAKPESPADPLGRTTPRGTVRGFLNAARRGEHDLARQYLDTKLSGSAAEDLAHQLFVVLDVRLPARVAQVSDDPEGSRADPLSPNLELVGTIASAAGSVNIVVERMPGGKTGPIWLFSKKTLDSIPDVYDEIQHNVSLLPRVLTRTRLGGVRLLEWVAILTGLAIVYAATVLLNRALTPLIGLVRRRRSTAADQGRRNVLPTPARLLLLALLARWLSSSLPLSLLMRQVWSNAVRLVMIAAIVWLLILLNGEIEEYVRRRLRRSDVGATRSLLRLVRRGFDLLVIFAGLLVTLRYFGVDPTPALAGLGVGGIAVALAAQKTLENVIAGASLIFDQAVRVGDSLKMGEIVGTVDHIGLRSTRIRTLDRTVVSVPNSQIANASLETLSARDKFWFHPVVGLRYGTTSDQLRAVVDGIRRLLVEHHSVDRESVRVRFHRLGGFSLDVDVFAYILARDWDHFLEIQEQLLFSITSIIEQAGTAIALPSQTMYVEKAQPADTIPAP